MQKRTKEKNAWANVTYKSRWIQSIWILRQLTYVMKYAIALREQMNSFKNGRMDGWMHETD